MTLTKKLFLLVSFVVFMAGLVKGQTNIPYTRFGLGALEEPEFAYLRGWGSISAPYHSPFNVNFSNPASYSDIKLTVFEAGVYGSVLKLRSSDSSEYFGDGSISNLAMGFPVIKNKMGMSFGIVPFSRVSYAVGQVNDTIEGVGPSFNLFQGTGGLYRFFIGAGYKIHHLSLGLNASYLFGEIDYSDILAFDDTANAYNTRKQEFRSVGDFVFDGGVQYQILMGETNEYSLDLGLTGNLKTKVNTRRNLIYDRFNYRDALGNPSTTPLSFDTIYSVLGEKGDIVLPASFSVGAIFSRVNHYSVGINYKYGKWSDFRTFGSIDSTTDKWRLGIGGQFIPNSTAYQQYWKLITYRAGVQLGKDYIRFNGNDIPKTTVSIGAGFPMKRVVSQIAVGMEWTHSGKLDLNPLTTSYFRLSAGLTLNDKWFQKRKFE